MELYNVWKRNAYGLLIVLDMRLWKLSFDILWYKGYGKFIAFGKHKQFNYRYLNIGKLGLRVLWD